MGWMTSALLMAVLNVPVVEVTTLQGEPYSGRLNRLTESAVSVVQQDTTREVPLAAVMEVRFARPDNAEPAARPPMQVALVDGSRFGCTEMSAGLDDVSIASPNLGRFTVPLKSVGSIRFAPADSKVETSWNELRQRDLKQDLLVVRNADVLDYLEGVAGRIDEKTVHFLLQGDEIPVERGKVFGVIYVRSKTGNQAPFCEASFNGSDVVQLRALSYNGEQMQAELMAGANVTLPIEHLRSLDFSGAKVRYLSQMEPREVNYTPFFDITWEYRRDRNLDGRPLRVGDAEYDHGLSIHSKTELRYRLGGEYRRFQAVMGIDRNIEGWDVGDVHVVIRGDGTPLLETDVQGRDDPRPVDLDVTGISELQILVDFGKNLDIADHLDLADARVIK